MALPALGWKVQVWVPCTPTLASSHRCHASSLREEGEPVSPTVAAPLPRPLPALLWGHTVPTASAASLLLHLPRKASAARSWRGSVARSGGGEV